MSVRLHNSYESTTPNTLSISTIHEQDWRKRRTYSPNELRNTSIIHYLSREKPMKMPIKAAAATVAVGAALALAAGNASAATSETLAVSSPTANTAVFTVSNGGDASVSCNVFGDGTKYFETGLFRVAPRAQTTITMAAVPGGYYTIGWSCRSFAKPKQSLVIGGTATPSAQPHRVPNAAPSNPLPGLPALPPEVWAIVDGVLEAAGSS